ncbi:hypothetical protein MspRI1_10760 [Marinobacter sp. RI1]
MLGKVAGERMDPTTHLLDTRFFRALVFGPVAIGIALAVTAYLNHPTEIEWTFSGFNCSGSMIPDTNVGGKITTINEVSDDQKATFFFS